jgi:hypothetical protein
MRENAQTYDLTFSETSFLPVLDKWREVVEVKFTFSQNFFFSSFKFDVRFEVFFRIFFFEPQIQSKMARVFDFQKPSGAMPAATPSNSFSLSTDRTARPSNGGQRPAFQLDFGSSGSNA